MEDNMTLNWRTASYSGNGGGNCVEVANVASLIMVRDTKDSDSGTLTLTAIAWANFTASLK
jgi:hypothetical protein